MRKIATIAVAAALALTLGALAGCSAGTSTSTTTGAAPEGAPSLMPASHTGRFESLGASGCYGCHGANEAANPMLAQATVVPEDHYAQGSYATMSFDPVREQCITCHSQG
ncbi:MAG: hypothetical protein Q4C41_05725 [Eggerthellaceae bacterium]|nr:hypothetical protein [Eggerthellaceae bacterium]